MRLTSVVLSIVCLMSFCTLGRADEEIAKWEPEIRKLEALDATADPENAVLFIGSSSIRLWETIAQDVAPYPIISRGYGGAKFSDLNAYASRLVHPHACRAVVIFVANDVTGSKDDLSTEAVIKLVASITGTIREKLPTTPICFIEITPSLKRWSAWPKIRAVNNAIAEFCSDEEHVHFISTSAHYLDPETDRPIAAYFKEDGLHQNSDGYKVWGRLIKSRLDKILGEN